MASGSYNTAVMNDASFMSAATDIKFAKRLDEIKGNVTFGRKAASINWQSIKPVVAEEAKEASEAIQAVAKAPVKEQQQVAIVDEVAEPTIKEDMSLTVSSVFYKGELKSGSFSGSAKTMDGVLEEIRVTMPEGEPIVINTRERMQGNVFQYDDSLTGEPKSGLLYEVTEGNYMITLANDSRYPGVRINLAVENDDSTYGGNTIANNNAEVVYDQDYYQKTQGWGMDKQNVNDQFAADQTSERQNDSYDQDFQDGQNDGYSDRSAEGESFEFDFANS